MANSKFEIKSAAWLYPEVEGTNPPERWGHSACSSQGMLYVFGGCRGGVHFSDVMCLDLKTMTWSTMACTGQRPGTRDSHSCVLYGRKMLVFGGTDGSKKINDVHILDLDTCIWSCPSVQGQAPAARESHSATLVDGNRVVIFGGTGEGEGNYLNDIHFLELETMTWFSPTVKGQAPVRRDSHTAVAIKDQLIVYGGDCGDRYLGDIDVFDLCNFTWTKMETSGSQQPGVRAGHVAVEVENKVYIFGGVGDRAYYNDVWALDVGCCTWSRVEVAGLQPQGRFSHVAVLRDDDIAIYGGCGEDERPLDEVIVLHLGIEKLNSDFPRCKFAQSAYTSRRSTRPSVEVINDDGLCEGENNKLYKRSRLAELNLNKAWKGEAWSSGKQQSQAATIQAPLFRSSCSDGVDKTATHSDFHHRMRARKMPFQYMDNLESEIYAKRRKTTNLVGRLEGMDTEQDEISPTMSQLPSPTLSEQDKVPPSAPTTSKPLRPPVIFLQQQQQQEQQSKLHSRESSMLQQPQPSFVRVPTLQLQLHLPGHQTISLPVRETTAVTTTVHANEQAVKPKLGELKHQRPSLVGSEVRGVVDGAFDSGYLMTAQFNGQVFRGVLFSPGPMNATLSRQVQSGNNAAHVTQPKLFAASSRGQMHGYPVHLNERAVDVMVNGGDKAKSSEQQPTVRPANGGRWVWQPNSHGSAARTNLTTSRSIGVINGESSPETAPTITLSLGAPGQSSKS